jgi:ERCC4-type nuclease
MLEKYKYTENEQKELLKSMVIIIDSREKINSHITEYFDKHNIPYITKALPFGDYSFMIPKNEVLSIQRELYFSNDIIIERKANAEELSSNFSQSRTRFEEEFATSKANTKYLLIEECNYSDIVDGKYKTQYNSKSYLGSIHSFNQKYGLQVVFMPDNKYSPIFIYGTFQYYFRNIIK